MKAVITEANKGQAYRQTVVSRQVLANRAVRVVQTLESEAPFKTLKAMEERLRELMTVRRRWGKDRRLKLVEPGFACREVARGAANWGLVATSSVIRDTGSGSIKGLKLENKRLEAAGECMATV